MAGAYILCGVGPSIVGMADCTDVPCIRNGDHRGPHGHHRAAHAGPVPDDSLQRGAKAGPVHLGCAGGPGPERSDTLDNQAGAISGRWHVRGEDDLPGRQHRRDRDVQSDHQKRGAGLGCRWEGNPDWRAARGCDLRVVGGGHGWRAPDRLSRLALSELRWLSVDRSRWIAIDLAVAGPRTWIVLAEGRNIRPDVRASDLVDLPARHRPVRARAA